MTFLFPLGLIGLIGVPILILIYIIKSKYTEQIVASTYIWTLSERFLKRRNPLSRFTGIISLILQVLTIVVLSLVIAHPIFVIPGSAYEYCFVLDVSGSMNMQRADGQTRLEYGKEQIEELISGSAEGSIYSLVTVGDETVEVFVDVTDKEVALAMLDTVSATHGESVHVEGMAVAQEYFDANSTLKTYLVTDVEYETLTNVSLIHTGTEDENYSLYDVTYEDLGDEIAVRGRVDAHLSAARIFIDVYVDNSTQPTTQYETVLRTEEPTSFEIILPVKSFFVIDVKLRVEDALEYDNHCSLFNVARENNYKVLIVSDDSFRIRNAISVTGGDAADITVVPTDEYVGQSGYDLYVFDAYTPDEMPINGAVWFIEPNGNVEGSGFNLQTQVELDIAGTMVKSDSTASVVTKLTNGVIGSNIYIKGYSKCGLYDDFTTLFSYGGDPIIFIGANEYGNREVVFAFDFSETDFTVSTDFIVLVWNLMEYSFPAVVEKTNFKCGETLEINMLANCEFATVNTPLGRTEVVEPVGSIAELVLTESGTYTITLLVNDVPNTYYIFAESPLSEHDPAPTEEEIGLQGEAGIGGADGTYDNIMIFFIILAVLFIADWMVYCYEKYQLR